MVEMTIPHVIRPLSPETFPAWLALAQKHNGVWGGCYCSYFHGDTEQTVKDEYDRATFKQRLVNEGVAHAALVLDGALELIAEAGGGEVVSFPNELTPGKKTSSSFLHNGTRAMFQKAGFTFERHIGKNKTVMRKTIAPADG